MEATNPGPATSSWAPSSPDDLADYLRMLRRHWWILVLAIAAGVGAATAYTHQLPREYVSTASVLVHPAGLDANVAGGRTKGEINLDTEAQLMRSTAVVNGAAELLDRADHDALAAGVSVAVPANTSVLEINFAAPTAVQAQAGALAFAKAYLGNREENAKADLAGQTGALRGKLKELSADLAKINAKFAELRTDSSAYATLDSQRDTTVSQINQLNNKINQLGTETLNVGMIILEPRVPGSPTKPRVPVNLAAGALLGLLAGFGLAALRHRLDRRMRSRSDLARTDVALLGEVSVKSAPRFDDVFAPFSEGGRAFNRLRNEVVASMRPGEQVVLVTGASRGPAATLVAANLAAAMARTGTEVMLIGAHLPDSLVTGAPLARLLGVSPTPGLSDVLTGRANLADAIQRTARIPSLRVITTGGTASAAGLMQSQTLRDTISRLRLHADYLVIEAPSTATGADAQSLASLADAAIVAVELRRTLRPEIVDAAEQMRRVGTTLLGAVLLPRLKHRTASRKAGKEQAAAQAAAQAAVSRPSGPLPDPDRRDPGQHDLDDLDVTGIIGVATGDEPADGGDGDGDVPAESVREPGKRPSPNGSNGHKPQEGEETVMMSTLDDDDLALLDEAHGR